MFFFTRIQGVLLFSLYFTPLYAAAYTDSVESAQILISNGANINIASGI